MNRFIKVPSIDNSAAFQFVNLNAVASANVTNMDAANRQATVLLRLTDGNSVGLEGVDGFNVVVAMAG